VNQGPRQAGTAGKIQPAPKHQRRVLSGGPASLRNNDAIEERIAAVALPLPSTDASGPPPTDQEGPMDCEPEQAARRNLMD
jgi:hypothetical protein